MKNCKLHDVTPIKNKRVRNVIDFWDFDIELFFATEILQLQSLHYGYWDTPPVSSISVQNLRDAQVRYTQKLLSFIPDDVKTVLDVGSGIGDNARELLKRGYKVSALSPDKNHRRYFDSSRIDFHSVPFEEFSIEKQFDLVFLSESLNYFDWDLGLSQCARYTRSQKYLLVAAIFRRFDDRPYGAPLPKDKPFQVESIPYVHMAAEYGFLLKNSLDITDNVTPTITMISSAFQRYGAPIRLSYQLLSNLPLKDWFPRPFRKLEEIKSYYKKRLDPEHFQNCARYVILLFQKN